MGDLTKEQATWIWTNHAKPKPISPVKIERAIRNKQQKNHGAREQSCPRISRSLKINHKLEIEVLRKLKNESINLKAKQHPKTKIVRRKTGWIGIA